MFREILTGAQQTLLELLSRIPEIQTFYLAGGTGLALHLGHRRSRDFDFFRSKEFRPPPRVAGRGRQIPPDGLSYRHALEAARREVIAKALARTQGNRAAAARAVGLHKTHLLKLMKALGID